MALIVIHGINRQEKTSKEGKPYQRVGIKYRGKWYSGFGDEVTDTWEVGNQVDIDLWEEEGKPDKDGDIKTYGNFVRLTKAESKPRSTPATQPAPQEAPPPLGEVDASELPDLDEGLPF